MLKRTLILVFILSTLALLALNPMNAAPASELAPKLQTTVEVTVAVVTSQPESTPGTIPVTGGQLPMSIWIIFGLLAIIGIGVVLGGIALLSRRQL
jgi:hypothetical protein